MRLKYVEITRDASYRDISYGTRALAFPRVVTRDDGTDCFANNFFLLALSQRAIVRVGSHKIVANVTSTRRARSLINSTETHQYVCARDCMRLCVCVCVQ